MHLQRENQTTLDDLHSKNIVMLADCAHHLNKNTNKKQLELNLNLEITGRTNDAEIKKKGWERSILKLFQLTFNILQGRGFQPDFILFLKEEKLYYQIFIEPKGNEFIGEDGTFKTGKEGWKEQFLEEISEKYGFEKIIKAENPNYRLIGLPFFNKDHNSNFKKKYELVINE